MGSLGACHMAPSPLPQHQPFHPSPYTSSWNPMNILANSFLEIMHHLHAWAGAGKHAECRTPPHCCTHFRRAILQVLASLALGEHRRVKVLQPSGASPLILRHISTPSVLVPMGSVGSGRNRSRVFRVLGFFRLNLLSNPLSQRMERCHASMHAAALEAATH